MVTMPRPLDSDSAGRTCEECTRLYRAYSAAVFQHVKLDSQCKLAALQYEAGEYDDIERAVRLAAEARTDAQNKMKEHKALHGGMADGIVTGRAEA